MAWIESHQEISRHPKTKRLARELSIPIPAAVGHLHCLWHWAMDFASDGDLTGFDVEEIAAAAMWEPDDYDESRHGTYADMYKALVKTGWIDTEGERCLLHDWEHYAGKFLAAKRAQAAGAAKGNHKRWHVDRDITDPDCQFCTGGDIAPPSDSDSPTDQSPTTGRIVPNLTQPNPTEPDPNPKEHSPPAVVGAKSLAEKYIHKARRALGNGKTDSAFETFKAAFELTWEDAVSLDNVDPRSASALIMGAFLEDMAERRPQEDEWKFIHLLLRSFGQAAFEGFHEGLSRHPDEPQTWFKYARGVCKKALQEAR